MSVPILILIGALVYGLLIRFVLRLCRAAADPPAAWAPVVPPSAEVLAEMRRHGEIA